MWVNLVTEIGNTTMLLAQVRLPDFNFNHDVIIYGDEVFCKTEQRGTYLKASVYIGNRPDQHRSPLKVNT